MLRFYYGDEDLFNSAQQTTHTVGCDLHTLKINKWCQYSHLKLVTIRPRTHESYLRTF